MKRMTSLEPKIKWEKEMSVCNFVAVVVMIVVKIPKKRPSER